VRREEPANTPKPFDISKRVVWEAYKRVKANAGAAGVDRETIAEFEQDLKGNLYKLWNRLSSGCYFPPPVRMVEIPKPGGRGVRVLGVPTVADRIAQTVVRLYLEPDVEPVFHEGSYGYRPGRSALDAVGKCRERCWKMDWVIDLDIRAFFDSLPHDLVMKAVAHHTQEKWILLYVQRWLTAPLQAADGTLIARDRGSPQGSAISPLLANLFLHYAFDTWLSRRFPGIAFERYCDDVVVHCTSEQQAQIVLAAIGQRLAECRLELNETKTRIVYCKDKTRRGTHVHEQFDFLGYSFRPRLVKGPAEYFVGFTPAMSAAAGKEIRGTIRRWRLHLRSHSTLSDLARDINVIVRGWTNYYGRFHKSAMEASLRHINDYLVRWAERKYRKLRGHRTRARRWVATVARRDPRLFAHWAFGARP
jgi:RNA-directed DNA polymerase